MEVGEASVVGDEKASETSECGAKADGGHVWKQAREAGAALRHRTQDIVGMLGCAHTLRPYVLTPRCCHCDDVPAGLRARAEGELAAVTVRLDTR